MSVLKQMLIIFPGNLAQRHVGDSMEGEFGEEGIHVYVWLSPFVPCPPITTLFLVVFFKTLAALSCLIFKI